MFKRNRDGIPLLTTIGVTDVEEVNGEIVDNMWRGVTSIYRPLRNVSVIPGISATSAIHGKYPETSFICDILYPYMRYLATDVLEWNKDFTKCFGIGMLKGLSLMK